MQHLNVNAKKPIATASCRMKLPHKHSDGGIAMSYTHLTTAERVKIETYLELGMSIRSIARRLGRQPSTVSREIRRNPDYVAERARKRYEKAKTNCGAKTKLDDTMRRTIVEKLRAT
ncbi:IS30 family transposase, partial [Listeria monocytogenes]|nr:helix-turn-helix domain-containing protein [Listeria monocytogenes]EKY7559118.1 IS30 family transposase [Listeria monocytogenes]HAO5676099.1 IS30 family transposase [Listeria monocytogenes]